MTQPPAGTTTQQEIKAASVQYMPRWTHLVPAVEATEQEVEQRNEEGRRGEVAHRTQHLERPEDRPIIADETDQRPAKQPDENGDVDERQIEERKVLKMERIGVQVDGRLQ